MKGKTSFVTALIVLLFIFIFSNIIVAAVFRQFRIDMTEENIYSLSSGTKNILHKLEENITLKFYFSKTETVAVPFIKNYATNVRDILNEYKNSGGGKIILEIYDPRPDSEEQEWAEKFGIKSVTLQSGMPIYFGLAGVNELGDEDVIAFFDPQREEFLEYDITRLIYNLSNPKKKVIGLMSSLPVLGAEINQFAPPGPSNRRIDPWLFTKELKHLYTLKDLGTNVNKIEDDIDILLLIHPKDPSDDSLFAIDQFILNGGKAIIFIDPYCEAEIPSHDPQKPYEAMLAKIDSNLEKLFNTWGLKLVEGEVAADRSIATRVNVGANNVLPYIVWLNLSEENISRDDIISAKLENILLPYPGVLKMQDSENIITTPIFETTNTANTVNAQGMTLNNPISLIDSYTPGTEKLTLALRLSGKFKSAFPEGKPVKDDKDDSKKDDSTKDDKPLKESKEKANIIVVADVDMLSDRFSVRVQNLLGHKITFPLNDNLNFIYNAIENLSGSDDLISIRSRGKFTRPFTKVKDIERKAEERWKDEEKALQMKVNEMNSRINDLIKSGKKQEKQMLSHAILDEINKYRIERKHAQKKLREVRRKLRQEKESLGNNLFVINTFLIPLFISISGIAIFIIKRRKQGSKS